MTLLRNILKTMKKKIHLKLFIGILALVVTSVVFITIFIDPWAQKRIAASLNDLNGEYLVQIDDVHVSIFNSKVELETITISSNQKSLNSNNISGQIKSIEFKGISLWKLLFTHDLDIDEVSLKNCKVSGEIFDSKKTKDLVISTVNIYLGKLHIDTLDVALNNGSSAQQYSIKKGLLNIYNLELNKKDTLKAGIFRKFDFKADELFVVQADSMYSFKVNGLILSDSSKTLAIDSISIQPNFEDYEFASRHAFESDRIEATFRNIHASDVSAAGYLCSGSLESTYLEIQSMDMQVFRDKRKAVLHEKKTEFQDLIYNYNGAVHIDSIAVLEGKITYTEHEKLAREAGSIYFDAIDARFYNISKLPKFRTKTEFMVLKVKSQLMGQGEINVILKAEIFDSLNTFSVSGTLSEMDGKALNPILEHNAFLFVTSCNIDRLDFNFEANSKESNGEVKLLYNRLHLAIKNKQRDDTTGLKAKFISYLANNKLLNSNPIHRKEVRVGKIYFKRNPERFLFSYCFKSILSGIKISITKEK